MLDCFAQLRQVVERNGRIHVVFKVILHIPVVERGEPRTCECSSVQAEIRLVRVQAVVLGHSAKEPQPATVESPECDGHYEEWMSDDYEYKREQAVSTYEYPRPNAVFLA